MAQSRGLMCQLPPTFGDGAGVRFSCTHAFTTTGTTRTISLPFRKIFDVKATYTTNSVANTDGPLSVDNAGGNGWSGGLLTVDTDGTVTVTRPAGTTSGAAFEFSCTGLGL